MNAPLSGLPTGGVDGFGRVLPVFSKVVNQIWADMVDQTANQNAKCVQQKHLPVIGNI